MAASPVLEECTICTKDHARPDGVDDRPPRTRRQPRAARQVRDTTGHLLVSLAMPARRWSPLPLRLLLSHAAR
jgi:hypothetical protein